MFSDESDNRNPSNYEGVEERNLSNCTQHLKTLDAAVNFNTTFT
ncbi:hypothetical protein T08_1201 [Trichinella sp. T8]|nr:hypothetical protein T08_1201 [Trichinella sp. T8]